MGSNARKLIVFLILIPSLVATILIPFARSASAAATPAASTPCAVTYQLNQWTGGFTAQVNLQNNTGVALTNWTLTWTFAGDQLVTSAWNTKITQSAAKVTANDLGYNASLPNGGSVQFGFQATFTGTNAVPNDFALNGTSCGGNATTTPTAVPTTPTTTIPVTPTATPPVGTSCTGATFCDTFESQTGSTPSGNWQVSYPNCQGTGSVAVDRTVAYSGSTSIRVDGHAGYCNHVFFGTQNTIATIGSNLYVRFFIRHTTALPTGHVTFVAMRDTNDSSKDLRMGGQNGALQWNRESDDATLPAQSPAGVALSMPLPINQWSCVEFGINESLGTMSTWLNGNEVLGLHLDGTPTQDVDNQWLSRANWRPALNDLRLGWESYSDGDDTLWFDNVAISSQKVGCTA
jgi:hypothetical protein